MRIEITETETRILCGAELDINTVLSQRAIFNQALETNQAITLRAEEIAKIDTAGLQLILNFCLNLKQKKIPWTWANPSRLLIETTALHGMQELLGLTKAEVG